MPRLPILVGMCAVAVAFAPADVFSQADSLATITWIEGAKVPSARDHHATVTARAGAHDFLYVIGGTNYKEMFANVAAAEIGQDGRVAAWHDVTPLPFARAGLAAVAADKVVIVSGGQIDTAGGVRNLKRITDVAIAEILPGGNLGAWKTAAPLPHPRFHHPMVYHKGWVYVVGGQGEKEAESNVHAARLSDQNDITAWIELRPLPRPRSHHAAFIEGDFLYVVGGLDGVVAGHNAHFFDVIRAQILSDGSLGEWRIVARAPNTYATHAAFASGGFLWIVGGVENGAVFSDAIWRAPLELDGRIGAWHKLGSTLPVGRGHVHHTPVVRGRIYSVGGRIAGSAGASGPTVIDAVHIGALK